MKSWQCANRDMCDVYQLICPASLHQKQDEHPYFGYMYPQNIPALIILLTVVFYMLFLILFIIQGTHHARRWFVRNRQPLIFRAGYWRNAFPVLRKKRRAFAFCATICATILVHCQVFCADISNSLSRTVKFDTNQRENHGIASQSIYAFARKHNVITDYSAQNGVFSIRIMFT